MWGPFTDMPSSHRLLSDAGSRTRLSVCPGEIRLCPGIVPPKEVLASRLVRFCHSLDFLFVLYE